MRTVTSATLLLSGWTRSSWPDGHVQWLYPGTCGRYSFNQARGLWRKGWRK